MRWQRAVLVAAAFGVFATGCKKEKPAPKNLTRYGSVIGVNDEKLDYYKKLHAAVWPGILKMITDCNIQNYSIYLRKMPDGKRYLFSCISQFNGRV